MSAGELLVLILVAFLFACSIAAFIGIGRDEVARHRARVMHPCNGEARRLPERRATAERVAELDEWLEGR